MLKAFPRHSVDISAKEYRKIFSWLLSFNSSMDGSLANFEEEFRTYIGTQYSISIPSARLGLYILFKHFALPEGSEIIISPFTHWSIFSVIKACRLKPVFVDIEELTFNINPNETRKKINKNTKLLIVTHMWGQPCDMAPFIDLKKEFGIKIIEDCAMACGATYMDGKAGSFGDASIFSFGKAKAISTFGGGMLCTNDKSIYEFAKRNTANFKYERPLSLAGNVLSSVIANILTRPRFFFLSVYPIMRIFHIKDPYNPMEHKKDVSIYFDDLPEQWKTRMSSLQAIVGSEQLKELDIKNSLRMVNADVLNKILKGSNGVDVPLPSLGARHIYLYYALLITKRASLDDIREKLIRNGIDSQSNELTTAKDLAVFGAESRDYPVFNRVSESILIIPNGIYLSIEDVHYVGNTVKRVLDTIE